MTAETAPTSAATQNTRLGIWLMIATTLVFAVQDGISRHLGSSYSIYMVVMIRFWFFALFVMAMAARAPGGHPGRCPLGHALGAAGPRA